MSKLYFGGIPTKIDVDKLMALELQPGAALPYADVEALIQVERGTNRFRTVTDAWRKRLFREKLIQSSAYGETFHLLTPDEAHDRGREGISRVGRMVRRTRIGIEAVDASQLTGDRRDKHNLLRREAEIVHDAVLKSAKEIAAPAPSAGRALRIAK